MFIRWHVNSPQIPRDDERLTAWLYDRYIEKERMLAEFYATGNFPNKPSPQFPAPRPLQPTEQPVVPSTDPAAEQIKNTEQPVVPYSDPAADQMNTTGQPAEQIKKQITQLPILQTIGHDKTMPESKRAKSNEDDHEQDHVEVKNVSCLGDGAMQKSNVLISNKECVSSLNSDVSCPNNLPVREASIVRSNDTSEQPVNAANDIKQINVNVADSKFDGERFKLQEQYVQNSIADVAVSNSSKQLNARSDGMSSLLKCSIQGDPSLGNNPVYYESLSTCAGNDSVNNNSPKHGIIDASSNLSNSEVAPLCSETHRPDLGMLPGAILVQDPLEFVLRHIFYIVSSYIAYSALSYACPTILQWCC